jgi:thioredoxin reductase
MDDNGISITVIGGGIGGLTAALCTKIATTIIIHTEKGDRNDRHR